jgi:hypothetical protein
MHLEGETKVKSYIADAISANTNISSTHFDEFHKYRIEWIPGPEGYIEWFNLSKSIDFVCLLRNILFILSI